MGNEKNIDINIELNIKGTKIMLNMDEIKSLKEVLEKITGKDKEYVPYPYYIPYYNPYYYYDWTITTLPGVNDNLNPTITYGVTLT